MQPATPLPGTQDLLFEAARRLRRCEATLCARFEAKGYAEVIPPAIEAADVFGPEAFRALDRNGRLIALRADFTAQVARIAATRLSGMSPLRLYYRGSIVRRVAPDSGPVHERLQAGCELVGAAGAEADAEILALAAASLHALGIRGRISLGSTGYFSALAAAAGAGGRLAAALNDAIDRKDLPTLRSLCEREVTPGKARDALLLLAQPPRPQTPRSAAPRSTYKGTSPSLRTTKRAEEPAAMISFRDVPGSSSGTTPACANRSSAGRCSRPLGRAMVSMRAAPARRDRARIRPRAGDRRSGRAGYRSGHRRRPDGARRSRTD